MTTATTTKPKPFTDEPIEFCTCDKYDDECQKPHDYDEMDDRYVYRIPWKGGYGTETGAPTFSEFIYNFSDYVDEEYPFTPGECHIWDKEAGIKVDCAEFVAEFLRPRWID